MTHKRLDGAALQLALEKCEQVVMGLVGVQGVALTEVAGKPHIAVYVDRLTDKLRAQIAKEWDGVPVKIEITDTFEAQ